MQNFQLDLLQVVIRTVMAVVIGALIGSERALHGRAAGVRTHILVCLGACMTSMTSLFVADILGHDGDVFRIPAQVISGIGFLGAGMIILKSNNVIAGLTTAAGVWATGAIGIAIGYGFYFGSLLVTAFFLATIILFAKFERRKKTTEVVYVEIDDMYNANTIILQIREKLNTNFTYHFIAPKSAGTGHLGINLIIEKRIDFDMTELCSINSIVFVAED